MLLVQRVEHHRVGQDLVEQPAARRLGLVREPDGQRPERVEALDLGAGQIELRLRRASPGMTVGARRGGGLRSHDEPPAGSSSIGASRWTPAKAGRRRHHRSVANAAPARMTRRRTRARRRWPWRRALRSGLPTRARAGIRPGSPRAPCSSRRPLSPAWRATGRGSGPCWSASRRRSSTSSEPATRALSWRLAFAAAGAATGWAVRRPASVGPGLAPRASGDVDATLGVDREMRVVGDLPGVAVGSA